MKHAYLIMAHSEFEVLEKLLKLLDDPRNDIYIHIDKKVKKFNLEKYRNIVKKSKINFIKRMDIRWGSNKQIKCTLMLLEEALKEKHAYYHFISGVDLPLKTQDEIHHFFSNTNKDFIEFDDYDLIKENYLDRVKYYHLCQNNWRNKNKIISKITNAIRYRTYKLQKKSKINRIKNQKIEFRKGANWFSITEKTAKYIIEQTNNLKMFNHTYCADELFVQTIIYNSKLKKNIYLKDKNKTTNLRYIDWKKGNPAILTTDDYEDMINSNMLFARKFSYKRDSEVIDKLYNKLKN